MSGVRHARLGKRIEFKIVGQAEIRLGDQVRIDDGAILGTDRTLQIGARSYVGPYATIYDSAGLSIGEDVLIGPHAVITAGNHRFERLDIPINRQDNSRLGIKIEDDVWVGANAVVLDGVTVGHGAVVAAGAVVTRDVAPFAVVAGVPAREISVRGGVGQALG